MTIILNAQGKPENVDSKQLALMQAAEILETVGLKLTEVVAPVNDISMYEAVNRRIMVIPTGIEKLYFHKKQRFLGGIKILIEHMMQKLHHPKNLAKGDDLSKENPQRILANILDETNELVDAVIDYQSEGNSGIAAKEIKKECGDIANYLAMLCQIIADD